MNRFELITSFKEKYKNDNRFLHNDAEKNRM